MNRAEEFARKLLGGSAPATAAGGVMDPGTETLAPLAPCTPPGREAGVTQLPVEQLQRGRYQPRVEFDPAKLAELADSIRAQGVVQPIIVRPVDAEHYEILAGERRWRAAQLAGLNAVPVIVRELSDGAALTLTLIENIQREHLNPLEEAQALQQLQTHLEATNGAAPTQHMLAAQVGKSVPWVSKRLALLERPQAVQQAVLDGTLALDAAARRTTDATPARPPKAAPTRTASLVRVDWAVLQASVRRLNQLAGRLGVPVMDLPAKPARKDVIAAFERHALGILDAAHRAVDSE